MKETQNKFKDMVTLADIVFQISLENNTKKSNQTFFFFAVNALDLKLARDSQFQGMLLKQTKKHT